MSREYTRADERIRSNDCPKLVLRRRTCRRRAPTPQHRRPLFARSELVVVRAPRGVSRPPVPDRSSPPPNQNKTGWRTDAAKPSSMPRTHERSDDGTLPRARSDGSHTSVLTQMAFKSQPGGIRGFSRRFNRRRRGRAKTTRQSRAERNQPTGRPFHNCDFSASPADQGSCGTPLCSVSSRRLLLPPPTNLAIK
jgi:hypothetical protein